MKEWKLEDLKKEYNLDLEKIIEIIKNENAMLVLLQFPDGLKQYAKSIVDYLEKKTNVDFLIYLGSCFGACDTPEMKNIPIDLAIQIGHNFLMPSYLP